MDARGPGPPGGSPQAAGHPPAASRGLCPAPRRPRPPLPGPWPGPWLPGGPPGLWLAPLCGFIGRGRDHPLPGGAREATSPRRPARAWHTAGSLRRRGARARLCPLPRGPVSAPPGPTLGGRRAVPAPGPEAEQVPAGSPAGSPRRCGLSTAWHRAGPAPECRRLHGGPEELGSPAQAPRGTGRRLPGPGPGGGRDLTHTHTPPPRPRPRRQAEASHTGRPPQDLEGETEAHRRTRSPPGRLCDPKPRAFSLRRAGSRQPTSPVPPAPALPCPPGPERLPVRLSPQPSALRSTALPGSGGGGAGRAEPRDAGGPPPSAGGGRGVWGP